MKVITSGCEKFIRKMFNLDQFIADSVTKRPVSMFAVDIEANKEMLSQEIKDKKICVIGGAGSIGSSFIKDFMNLDIAADRE